MSEIKVGDVAHYSPRIGGPNDGRVYEVRHVGVLYSGEPVAWLRGKAGAVSVHALSPAPTGEERET